MTDPEGGTPLSERINAGCTCARAGLCWHCRFAAEAAQLEHALSASERRVAELCRALEVVLLIAFNGWKAKGEYESCLSAQNVLMNAQHEAALSARDETRG